MATSGNEWREERENEGPPCKRGYKLEMPTPWQGLAILFLIVYLCIERERERERERVLEG